MVTVMAVSGARATREQGDKIEPSRAGAALTRWRRAVAEAMGQDPGASLDQPDRRLLMLRVFGATRRLGELCMTHPAAAATALIDGPSTVLAEAARDLAGLERGVGGPDALHAALAPLKNRADMAIALAELGEHWSVAEATSARVDFAERLVETALQWLVRAAVKRGELTVSDADNVMAGICIVAGGAFAHEDLSPYGPVDLITLYDEAAFPGPAGRGVDRVFVRIGAEFREAFEGKPGDFPLFALRTPLGSGVGGAGYADSVARVRATADGPQAQGLRTWLATARIVAGDRVSGGKFLEGIEDLVWGETPIVNEELRDVLEKASDDPRAVYWRIADLCRLAIGGARPVFRTASARGVFETAAKSRAISPDAMRRLVAGEELSNLVVSRTQMMKGVATSEVVREDEQAALAALCGFAAYDALAAALDGARIDAQNTLRRMMNGPQREVEKYKSADDDQDADKLEDLGFFNGESLSASVDKWAKHAASQGGDARFSAHAPGLLTAFGETQKPNQAVQSFDRLVANAGQKADVFSLVGEHAPQRDPLVNAIGCFSGAIEPLTHSAEQVGVFFEDAGAQTPQSGEEWLGRFTPPSAKGATSLDALAGWRRETIARIALSAASGATSFDAAAEALEDIHIRTLADAFEIARNSASKPEASAAKKIALHVFDGAGSHLPGAASHLGFIAGDDVGEAGEAFVKTYLEMLRGFGEGVFAIAPDTSHRPSGVTGPLAPSLEAFKSYVQSEAVAYDQIMLARGRVIAGDEKITEAARDALRGAVSGARRADMLFRDLDRARAQRMRRERAASDWDLDRLEGGRLDVELVISTLIYRHAPAHPFVQETRADEALRAMARSGLLPDETALALISARQFWTRLQVVRQLAQWSDPVREPVRPRFGELIARAAGVEKFDQVRPLMRGYADDVSRLYAQLVLNRPSLSVVAQAAG
jgi:[glutamine synthetase] adenylyltransferase / [glutamine synthetase]-adenylyl-L-tyrosine phosphorylase